VLLISILVIIAAVIFYKKCIAGERIETDSYFSVD